LEQSEFNRGAFVMNFFQSFPASLPSEIFRQKSACLVEFTPVTAKRIQQRRSGFNGGQHSSLPALLL
jgi:hypothetical protein